ncbi:glycosyltransferase family 2 protein [bacterium]|nr:glycosyltransferase family 2 protein [bacterium]
MAINISVIIPIYNAEKYLTRCLKSLEIQTYSSFEVIMINDGSYDNSQDICLQYCNNDTRFKLINQNNSGSQEARKNGVINSTGDYITFIDADDFIDPNYFTDIIKKIEKTNPDIFCVGFTKENNGISEKVYNNISSGYYERDNLRTIIDKIIFFGEKFYESGIIASNWSKFIKRDLATFIFPKVNKFLKMGEDAVCIYACINNCSSIEICNEIYGYHYVNNDNSIINSYDKLYFQRFIQLKNDFNNLIINGKYKNEFSKQIPYYYSFFLQYGFSILKSYYIKSFSFVKMLKEIKAALNIIDISDIQINNLISLPKYTKKLLNAINRKSLLTIIVLLFFY